MYYSLPPSLCCFICPYPKYTTTEIIIIDHTPNRSTNTLRT